MGYILSYLHPVEPGVSACCADAKWRDLLTFTAYSLPCTPVTIFVAMTMNDPNQSNAIFIHHMWQGGIMLSYILLTAMCMQLLAFSTITCSDSPHNVVLSSSIITHTGRRWAASNRFSRHPPYTIFLSHEHCSFQPRHSSLLALHYKQFECE